MLDRLTLIYALPAGETERYMEELLSTQCKTPEQVQKVIETATKDGWHSFRVTVDDGSPPDFVKALTSKGAKQ